MLTPIPPLNWDFGVALAIPATAPRVALGLAKYAVQRGKGEPSHICASIRDQYL